MKFANLKNFRQRIFFKVLRAFVVSMPLSCVTSAFGQTQIPKDQAPSSTTEERVFVNSVMILNDIKSLGTGVSELRFLPEAKSDPYDFHFIETKSRLPQLILGQKYRVRGFGYKGPNRSLEIRQLMIEVEVNQTKVPIWMLSLKQKRLDLDSAPYLDMHAPANDYIVL